MLLSLIKMIMACLNKHFFNHNCMQLAKSMILLKIIKFIIYDIQAWKPMSAIQWLRLCKFCITFI